MKDLLTNLTIIINQKNGKKIIWIFLIFDILIFIKFLLKEKNQIKNTNQTLKIFGSRQKKSRRENFIKLNNYNIYMKNTENFSKNKYLILLPDKNCPKKELKTIFFKPEQSLKYAKLKKKDISLESREKEETVPSAFVENLADIRTKFLKRAGFNIDQKMGSYNIYLTPYNFKKNFIEGLTPFIYNKFQKINKYFNYMEYISKSSLYSNYKNFKDRYPNDYDYMFETYSYPEQKNIIKKKFKNYIINESNYLWMIKPKLASLGNNISILKDFSQIKLKDYIITKFLDNPHLINGYKYDIRFHGLISSIKPLKLYLYNEGFVRFCSEKYNFSTYSLDNKYEFITNIYLNKKNKEKYIYPKNSSEIEKSHLWNLETLKNYYKRNNINYNKIYSEVSDIFIKSLLTVREKLIKTILNYKLKFSNFYHLIGFDIILDENLKPYLLEFNRRCSLRDDNVAEKNYVYNLIVDTLNIIGITTEKNYNDNKNKKEILKNVIEDNLCELVRPRGGYELIFPKKDNFKKYMKFFGGSIPKEDKELWNNLFN